MHRPTGRRLRGDPDPSLPPSRAQTYANREQHFFAQLSGRQQHDRRPEFPFSTYFAGGGGISRETISWGKFRFSVWRRNFPHEFSLRNSGHFLLSVHPHWRRSFPCLMALQQNWRCHEIFPAQNLPIEVFPHEPPPSPLYFEWSAVFYPHFCVVKILRIEWIFQNMPKTNE